MSVVKEFKRYKYITLKRNFKNGNMETHNNRS